MSLSIVRSEHDSWPDTIVVPDAQLHASLYAALHSGTPGDVQFYLRACAGAVQVAEFGVGAGRVALPLAEDGVRVVGVEREVALLELAGRNLSQRQALLQRALPLQFHHADMADFASPPVFDRVLIPYSGLWCLPNGASKRACLQAAYRCLRAGGLLCLDAYDADELGEGDEDGAEPLVDDFEPTHTIEWGGAAVTVLERNVWWPERRELRVDYQLLASGSATSGWRAK